MKRLKEWSGLVAFVSMIFIAGGSWFTLKGTVSSLKIRIDSLEKVVTASDAALVNQCVALSKAASSGEFVSSENANSAMLRLGCDHLRKEQSGR